MPVELNHTIVPSRNKEESAQFYARILGVDYVGEMGPFIAVKITDSLTFDFADREEFSSHHYAFKVSEPEFDEIFGRIKSEELQYGSGPFTPTDMAINHRDGGRGVYWVDPDGHLLEIITRDYEDEQP